MSSTIASTIPGSLRWFADHEARLFWRDAVSMWTAGNPGRAAKIGLILAIVAIGFHFLAVWLLQPLAEGGIVADKATLLAVSGAFAMLVSLMFSQSLESVTRAYYARQDLDLILSSPVPARRLFIVRSLVLAAQTTLLSLLIAAPVINALIWLDGPKWFASYLLLISFGTLSTAVSFGVTLTLFRIVGPKRTRIIGQIISAIVGAGFVIALQGFAIIIGKGYSRFSLFLSEDSVAAMPALDANLWLPAKAAIGDPIALAIMIIIGVSALIIAVSVSSKRFASDVLLTSGLEKTSTTQKLFSGFKSHTGVKAYLRRKEWQLLWRDPWLMSQSLQQILYLMPPALLLWFNIGEDRSVLFVAVPVLVLAVGQLAGGLAWITVCGEDAHDLVATAPIRPLTVLQAKVEAVIVLIAVLLLPFMLLISTWSLRAALCLLGGAMCSAGCAVLVQLWFRRQANRSLFRRRQVSSRVATISEAIVSILCAAGAGLAIIHAGLIIIPLLPMLVVLGIAYTMRPRTS